MSDPYVDMLLGPSLEKKLEAELEVVNARLAQRTGEVQVAEARARELKKDNEALHKALKTINETDRLPLIFYENSVRDLQLDGLRAEIVDLKNDLFVKCPACGEGYHAHTMDDSENRYVASLKSDKEEAEKQTRELVKALQELEGLSSEGASGAELSVKMSKVIRSALSGTIHIGPAHVAPAPTKFKIEESSSIGVKGTEPPRFPPAPTASERTGRSVDVDGRVDENMGCAYIGDAHELEDGTWHCLANVRGMLALVEVKVTFEGER